MLSRLMTRREQALLFLLAVSILAGSAALVYNARRGETRSAPAAIAEKSRTAAPAPMQSLASAPKAAPKKTAAIDTQPQLPENPTAAPAPPPQIAIAITGSVFLPGLYRLDADARVGDLIAAAGGAKSDADLGRIALPARLIDGTTLHIPSTGASSRAAQAAFALNPPQYLAGGR